MLVRENAVVKQQVVVSSARSDADDEQSTAQCRGQRAEGESEDKGREVKLYAGGSGKSQRASGMERRKTRRDCIGFEDACG